MKSAQALKFIMAALLSASALSACQNQAQTGSGTPVQSSTPAAATQAATALTPVTYSQADDNSNWQTESPVTIELSEAGASIQGKGASVKDRTVTIAAAGTYVLSGTWEGGRIVVDAAKEDKIRLVLNGVMVQSKEGSAIQVKQADKVFLTLQEGTQNEVADAAAYPAADGNSDEPNAAIYSQEDLTINGAGELIVHGNYKDGITSKDDLKMTGGKVTVYAEDDGLLGRDAVGIKSGTVRIEAKGDGIKSTNEEEADKGMISVEGGAFQIAAGSDGIQSASSLQINGGTLTITSGGGSANGAAKTSTPAGGMRGKESAAPAASQAEDTVSRKGVKARTAISITKGTLQIDSADDAIHSNGTVAISDGTISALSGDDGIHADAAVQISGGKTDIAKSYEGIEGEAITLSGGEIRVTATDDGINVSGGADGSSVNGRPGQNSFSTASGTSKLTISGGTVYVDSMGDGLDANGSIVQSGGTVYVSGPTENNNGALDYDGTFDYSGGQLIAAGSSGMAQAPSDSSSQPSFLMTYSQSQKAGTLVELKDKNGNTLASYAPGKSFQSIVIGTPQLKKDTAYVLYTNGAKTVEFTAAASTTWLNESGVTTPRSGGPGGGGPGGNRARPGMDRPQ